MFLMSSQFPPLVAPIIAVSHLVKGDPFDINQVRESKKVKPSDGGANAMETDNTPCPPNNSDSEKTKPTFKDKVTASSSAKKKVNLYDQEEFEIEEDNVIIDKEFLIPEVWFSKTVQNELTVVVKQTLVVRLLSGDLGYTGLMTGIRTVLKPKGEYHITDLQNKLFLLEFELKSDYYHVLLDEP